MDQNFLKVTHHFKNYIDEQSEMIESSSSSSISLYKEGCDYNRKLRLSPMQLKT